MSTNSKFSVFIGGFRPWHKGHGKIVREALRNSDHLIIVVGSNNRARNTRLPFTVDERIELIRVGVSEFADPSRVTITSCPDFVYDDTKWNAGVQKAVYTAMRTIDPTATDADISLVGMQKDSTSYYLNNFPQWRKSISVDPEFHEDQIISSTTIRNKIFNGELDYQKLIQKPVLDRIHEIMERNPSEWERLRRDWNYEQKYSSIYGKGPFVTCDACVVQAGHVLLIQRGSEYGEGLFALPGGFLNLNEKIENGVFRELREETRLKVPEKVLRGCVTERRVFDDPYRSNRARIITHAYKIELNNDPNGLPKVVGSDDAKKAMWIPISVIEEMQNKFFEDHFDILSELLNI